MPLELKPVQSKDQFLPVVALEHDVYSNPSNSFWEMIKGPSVEECCERQWSWHVATQQSDWLLVEDSDSQEVVGAIEWILHETNPYEKPQPPADATWWEDGETCLYQGKIRVCLRL